MDVPVFNVFSEGDLQIYHGNLSYKWHQYVILCKLATCYERVFSTWLQLTTIILAVQRQWMLNFTAFCPSIHNAYT
jgi:hypothetical protein